jgi:hypothetical protein
MIEPGAFVAQVSKLRYASAGQILTLPPERGLCL